MVANQIALARDYIVRNPKATNYEVARETGCSLRTVTSARAELRRLGLVAPAFGDRGQSHRRDEAARENSSSPSEPFDIDTAADLNAAVEAERARGKEADDDLGEMTPAELKKMLWRVVKRNTDDRVVVAAASALGRIQADLEARPLGPGNPMTKADAKARLKMLFNACGLPLVLEVLEEMAGVTPKAE